MLKEKFNTSPDKLEALSLGKKREIQKRIDNLVGKYLNVEIYRYYNKIHSRVPYSGFKNIIYISSGIIRDFLILSSKMYGEMIIEKNITDLKFILPDIQTKIIYEESINKIQHLDNYIINAKNKP